MKTNNSEYELIGEQDGKLIVKVKHMGNQVTTITKAQGNIVFDFNHDQYNSNHRNERHQDKFFATSLEEPDINAIDALADRGSMEITSVYGNDHLLDMLIKNEDDQLRQQLIKQLPDALDTLTSKQRYAVLSYYCMGFRKSRLLTIWVSVMSWLVDMLKLAWKNYANSTELKSNQKSEPEMVHFFSAPGK